jgi:hypothetical protein
MSTTLEVHLSEAAREFAEREARARGYTSPGDFVAALVEEASRAATSSSPTQGRSGGPPADMSEELCDELSRRAADRHEGFGTD